jgi:hypothetical protein
VRVISPVRDWSSLVDPFRVEEHVQQREVFDAKQYRRVGGAYELRFIHGKDNDRGKSKLIYFLFQKNL